MNNKITFTPIEYSLEAISEYVTPPSSGSKILPEWFRSIPRYQNNDKAMNSSESGYHNLTVKHCMPFLDALNTGYYLTTWTDIHVKRKNGEPVISYKDSEIVSKVGPPIIYQKNFPSHIPTPNGYDPFSYVWFTYWRMKTPENVSCLITQPMNRTDLPFITLSGVIETDKWNGSDVLNFAFIKDFEGTIPKGTPYAQIIPFYRNDWEHDLVNEVDIKMSENRKYTIDQRRNRQSGFYRDKLWQKKSFK